MWPFTRKAERHTDGRPTAPVPVMRQEWKQLPALQRTIGEHPLTAPPAAFAADLVTHQDPSVTSGPLGHDVTREAPAGLVLGLVSATARPSTRNDGPAMIHRPRVQRQAAVSPGGTLDDHGAEASGPDQDSLAFAETAREVPVVPSPPVAQRLTSVAPDVAPVPVGKGLALQSRPHLQRSIAVEPESPSLNSASPDISDAIPDLPAAAGPQRLTLGQSRRLGLGAPLRQVPAAAVQRAADLPLARQAPTQTVPDANLPEPTPSRVESSAAAPASIQTGAIGATGATGADHRAGDSIGSPDSAALTAVPFESPPILQRAAALDLPLAPAGWSQATEGPAPVPAMQGGISGDLAGISGDVAGALGGAPGAVAQTESPESSPPSKAQPDATPGAAIQRRVDLESDPPMPAATKLELPLPQRRQATSGSDAPGQARSSFPAASYTATPLSRLAGTPFLASLQRAAQPTAGGRSERATEAAIQRIRSEFPVASGERGGSAGTARIQRSELETLDEHGPVNPGDAMMPGLTLLATPQPSQSRQSSTAVQRLPLQSQAQPQSGPADHPDMSLPLAPMASVASVQRATQIAESAIAVASQPMITAQRESFASEPPWQASEASVQAATATGAASSSATAPASAAHADENLDALAGKLYDRIRNRLKSELLLDRERAGLLTDLRG